MIHSQKREKTKSKKKKKETVKKGKEKNQCYKNSKIIFKCGKSHTIGETNSTCHEIIFLVVCYTTTSDIHLVIVQYQLEIIKWQITSKMKFAMT